MTLFEIGEELLALSALLDESNGELSPENEAAFNAWFEEIGEARGDKLDGYVQLIRRFEMEESAAKEEAERFQMTARVRGNSAKRMKERVKFWMEGVGEKKIQTTKMRTLSIQNNGGLTPLDVDENFKIEDVDSRFVKVRMELDTAAVREALDAGEELSFARLQPRGTHLRIK